MKPKEREGGEKQQRGSAAAGGGTRRVDDALRSEAGGVSRRIAFVAARRPDSNGLASGATRLVPLNPKAAAASKQRQAEAESEEEEEAAPRRVKPQAELFAESSLRMAWTSSCQMGAGLHNLGNTCFLNATLQCLTYLPPLANFALAGEHIKHKKGNGFSALFVMGEHIRAALAGSGRVLSPLTMVKNIKQIGRAFRIGRQEDAHEFTRYLVEAMQAACVGGRKLAPELAATSFVSRIFGGQLRSQLLCGCCSGKASNTYDPFLDLSLEITRAASVEKALARFCAVEVLDGDNKYRCDRTKKKVRATKRFSIEKAPNVLTLQLKRFEYGGFGAKINKQVDFTPVLDLRPFMSFPCVQESYAYRLTGVLVHSGRSTHSGHYFSFVRSPAGAWFLMDDETVRSVSEKTVLQQRAYMLFYTRTVAAHTAGAPAPVALPKQARAAALAAAPAAAPAGKSQSRRWMDAALPEAAAEPLPRAARLAGPRVLRSRLAQAAAALSPRKGAAAAASPPARRLRAASARELGMRHLLSGLLPALRQQERRSRRAGVQAAPAPPLAAPAQAMAPRAPVAAAKAGAARTPHASSALAVAPAPASALAPPVDDAEALRCALSYPRRYSAYGVDGVERWEGLAAPLTEAADALLRAQRPAFKRKVKDGWDEEYDRGKSKRVRAPRGAPGEGGEEDGASNPFERRTAASPGSARAAALGTTKRGAGRARRQAEQEREERGGGRGGRGRPGGRFGGGRGRGRGRRPLK